MNWHWKNCKHEENSFWTVLTNFFDFSYPSPVLRIYSLERIFIFVFFGPFSYSYRFISYKLLYIKKNSGITFFSNMFSALDIFLWTPMKNEFSKISKENRKSHRKPIELIKFRPISNSKCSLCSNPKFLVVVIIDSNLWRKEKVFHYTGNVSEEPIEGRNIEVFCSFHYFRSKFCKIRNSNNEK